MTTEFLLNLGLTLHLAGLSVSVGVTLAKYLSIRKLSSDDAGHHEKWLSILSAYKKLNVFMGIGMGVAILSGALMMRIAYSAFMQQVWFQAKIGVLLLIITGGILSNRKISKLKKSFAVKEPGLESGQLQMVRFITTTSGLQFMLFLVIIVLASFRFT
jgi:hypothetical protein